MSITKRIEKLDDKTIGKFYLGILALIIASTPLWVPSLLKANQESKQREQKIAQIRANCTGSKATDKEILSYDVYYDNGPSELPTCRLPQTEDEKAEMYRMRAYRQSLEAGYEDEPTLDENCTGRICQ